MTRPEDMLDDPDAPISEEEKAAAEELRLALEDPARANEDAELLRAASLAHEPRPIAEAEHRAIVERALAGEARARRAGPARRRAALAWGAGVAAGALALAAAVALLVGPLGGAGAPATPAAAPVSARVPLVQVRSTQPLFSEPFARVGGTSARVDRIALAREADLRDNQFALWGVK